MKLVNKTARSFDHELISNSVTRLRHLLDSHFPQFEFLSQFEHQLSLAEHAKRKAKGPAGKAPLRATKSIMAAVLGADSFSEIHAQSLTVDEDLVLANLGRRRKQQAARLCVFVNEQSLALGLTAPLSPLEMCDDFIDVWQPTMCAPDEYPETLLRASRAKAAGELPSWFQRVAPKLESASRPPEEQLPKKVVYEALALLKIANEEVITPTIWRSRAWLVMRENLGIAAVQLANTREGAKTIRATRVLEHLWESGLVYSGIQLARMYFHLNSPKRLNEQLAAEIIEKTYAQYLAEPIPSALFTCKESEAELYRMYATIKSEEIRHSDDPLDVLSLTTQLVDAALKASEAHFEGFGALVMCVLVPDFPHIHSAGNEQFFELREKIARFPEAESYCRQMADSPQVAALKRRTWA